MSRIEKFNLALRGLMEFGVVVGFAYWGYQVGSNPLMKILLAIGTPLVGFGIWGMIDFRNAGTMAEGLRLTEELIISGLAAVAVYISGQHMVGILLAVISVVYHFSVYLSGARLLKA